MKYNELFKEKTVIGRGNFGIAALVTEKSTGLNYIAKKIPLGSLNEYELRASKLEAKLLETLDHPNIVQYKLSFYEPTQVIIVMEYCPGGDLSQLIKSHKNLNSYFPEEQIKEWMVQLLKALSYLDSKKIIHRDLKSSNVYITIDGNLKLGDFGIAKVLSSTSEMAKTTVGTPYYMSPEVCENKPYTSKSDIWSLGCLFYEMVTLRHPFLGDSLLALVMSILKDSPPKIQGYSSELQSVIDIMLSKDMKNRPSALALLKFKYFETLDEEDEYPDDYELSNSEEDVILQSGGCFGLSAINPLELVCTQKFDVDESVNDVLKFSYSDTTIPTCTPDLEVHEEKIFRYSTFQVTSKKSEVKFVDDEYEDDFESVRGI